MTIIEFRDVKKQYGQKNIFQNVNINIPEKAFVILRGDSGSGKSTILNLIAGLEKPSAGQIIVDGNNIESMSAKEKNNFYRHEIGMIPQGSYLQPQFSLFENIILPGIFSGMPAAERDARANNLIQMLGIYNERNSLPTEVSGGQAGRACIARALLLNPKIILADEPTSNLDAANSEKVLKILDDIRQKLGVTIVVASHSRDAIKFATSVLDITNHTVVSNDI